MHAAQRFDRHVGNRQQAMPHVDDLLANQRKVESQQQVVGLVYGSGRGVFDRQHRAIDVPLDHRLEHLPEAAVRLERDRALRHREVLQCRLVSIGPFGALEPDANLLLRFAFGRVQRVMLPPLPKPPADEPIVRIGTGKVE